MNLNKQVRELPQDLVCCAECRHHLGRVKQYFQAGNPWVNHGSVLLDKYHISTRIFYIESYILLKFQRMQYHEAGNLEGKVL